MGNNNLNLSKKLRNDEFYTLYEDIEREMYLHIDSFKNKIVLCNCNDAESNFYKFFHEHFDEFKLKELICVNYVVGGHKLFGQKSYYKSYRGGTDLDLDVFNHVDIDGSGSFSSKESLKLLDYSDIVVTNPPYSKFIDFISILFKKNKKFIILSNIVSSRYNIVRNQIINNCIVYENRVNSFNGGVSSSCWVQNIDLNNNVEINLKQCNDFEQYLHYDNYDAINVDNVDDIPDNYFGKIGVPVSYVFKHPNNYFNIVDFVQHPFINNKEIFSRFIIQRRDNRF